MGSHRPHCEGHMGGSQTNSWLAGNEGMAGGKLQGVVCYFPKIRGTSI